VTQVSGDLSRKEGGHLGLFCCHSVLPPKDFSSLHVTFILGV
jgi:hypothetical protein